MGLLAPQAPDELTSESNLQLDSDAEYIWMLENDQGLSEAKLNYKHQIRHLLKSYYNSAQSSWAPQQPERIQTE